MGGEIHEEFPCRECDGIEYNLENGEFVCVRCALINPNIEEEAEHEWDGHYSTGNMLRNINRIGFFQFLRKIYFFYKIAFFLFLQKIREKSKKTEFRKSR